MKIRENAVVINLYLNDLKKEMIKLRTANANIQLFFLNTHKGILTKNTING